MADSSSTTSSSNAATTSTNLSSSSNATSSNQITSTQSSANDSARIDAQLTSLLASQGVKSNTATGSSSVETLTSSAQSLINASVAASLAGSKVSGNPITSSALNSIVSSNPTIQSSSNASSSASSSNAASASNQSAASASNTTSNAPKTGPAPVKTSDVGTKAVMTTEPGNPGSEKPSSAPSSASSSASSSVPSSAPSSSASSSAPSSVPSSTPSSASSSAPSLPDITPQSVPADSGWPQSVPDSSDSSSAQPPASSASTTTGSNTTKHQTGKTMYLQKTVFTKGGKIFTEPIVKGKDGHLSYAYSRKLKNADGSPKINQKTGKQEITHLQPTSLKLYNKEMVAAGKADKQLKDTDAVKKAHTALSKTHGVLTVDKYKSTFKGELVTGKGSHGGVADTTLSKVGKGKSVLRTAANKAIGNGLVDDDLNMATGSVNNRASKKQKSAAKAKLSKSGSAKSAKGKVTNVKTTAKTKPKAHAKAPDIGR